MQFFLQLDILPKSNEIKNSYFFKYKNKFRNIHTHISLRVHDPLSIALTFSQQRLHSCNPIIILRNITIRTNAASN